MNPLRLPIQFQLGALAVLLVAAFCVQLLLDVSRLREENGDRADAVIELQGVGSELQGLLTGGDGPSDESRLAVIHDSDAAVREIFADGDDPELAALVDDLSTGLQVLLTAGETDGPALEHARIQASSDANDRLLAALRTRNRATSIELGGKWNRLSGVVFVVLGLAVGLLLFTLVADRRLRRAETLHSDLEAAYLEVGFSRDAAERANREKTRLLGTVSHEFRSPMTGVIRMADVLRGTSLDADQKELVDLIRGSGTLLMTLVEQLFDFSRLESKEMELRSEEFDLLVATEEALVLLAPRAAAKGVEVSLHWAREVPRQVIGDGPRLRQILLNLVGNATKFTSSGRIEVRVALARSDLGTSVVRFEVEDTGPGIPVHMREQVFEPFSQGESDESSEGAGLGLAIVSRLVDAMDGGIGIESDLGVGTTFWFSLPLTVAPAQEAQQRLKQLGGKRVVVFEEDPVHRAVWEEELSRHGAGVVCLPLTADLDEALALPAWLVVVGTPNHGNSNELVDAVRSRRPGEPVLLTAPFGCGGELSSGADIAGLIHRPLRPSSLAARVVRVVLGAPPSSSDDSSIVGLELGDPPPAGAPRVLVVDDNETNRRFMGGLLRRAGYEVRLATNGFEAVDHVLSESFALVLMDLHMPDMDGIEATACIRESESGIRHTPIVAMTGDSIPGEIARFRDVGMDGVLPKPVSPDDLRAEVERWTS